MGKESAIELAGLVAGTQFRGHTVLGRYVWVVHHRGRAIGLVDVEHYDDSSASEISISM